MTSPGPDQTIQIRATKPEEYRQAADVVTTALLSSPPDDERWEKYAYTWDGWPSYTAWDGDRCVGHASQFLVDTVVPGGARLATGAVTRVGVLPSHRRRGVGRGVMEALIDDAAGRGCALMSLRASEAGIYERFGFGMAGDLAKVEIDTARARPLRSLNGAEPTGEIRVLVPDEIKAIVSTVYEAALGQRPGQITRPDVFWERYIRDAIDRKDGWFVAAHFNEAGEPDGYAEYSVRWDDSLPEYGGIGRLAEVIGVDDEAENAVWSYLLNIDLIRKWQCDFRPLDDAIRENLADRRAYQVTGVSDEQWVRLVDVDKALAARTYNPVDASITVAVTDPHLSSNNGVWHISSAGAEPLDNAGAGAATDLVADTTALSAAYLGGTAWTALVAAGRVTQTSPDAATRADLLFASRPLPFCGSDF